MEFSLWVRFFLVLLVLQLVVRPVLLARGFVRPPRLRVTFRTPADWGAAYRDVAITSADGTELAGWYLPGEPGPVIVLLHGHGGNRLATTFHAECLTAAGYSLLMLDLRAHGDSGGRRFAYSQAAVDDVIAGARFAARQPECDGRVGLMGISAGGTLALLAASQSNVVAAVAADGPSPVTHADFPPPASVFDRLWRYPMERIYQKLVDWFSQMPRCEPLVQVVPAIAPRPILLIATGSGFEQRLAKQLYGLAQDPKGLVELPQAGHAAGWRKAPESYTRNLTRFFDEALGRVDGDEVPPAA